MPLNQNRNSIRVLRTTGVGYLAHKNIPNFSVGGGKDFTIQLWVVKSGALDGSLYGQEGGFSIQLVGGRAVFSLPGCVTLAADNDWALPANRHDYIAVRFSQGKYTLFINGIPAAAKTAKAKAPECTGDYYIGKNFTGGFSLIRVSSMARSDQDILTDNAVPPKVDSHCVFQSDCSTAQYKDVSANHLPLWASGVGAGCGIYTACTAFSGNGLISCEPLKDLPATHTLLLKLWPQEADRRQQVYAAMDGDKILYAVELLPQENGSYKLAVTNAGGAQAVSTKTLLPQLWQDVAAVFDGGKVTLYMDGKREGTYSLPISGSRSAVLIGSEYENGRPYYDKGFFGYMAYTAEFGRVLPEKEIALYADDPPFMFEKGLVSLLPLDWPNEVESIGATPLHVTGSAPFTMVEGITPRDGSIGVSVRLPTEVPPEWEKLSEDEKWAFQLLDELMLDTAAKMRGFPTQTSAKGSPFPLGSLFPYTRYHARRVYVQLIEMDPFMSEFEMRELERQLFDLAGKLTVAYERIVGAVTAGAAGAYSFCTGMVDAILVSSVGAASVEVLVASLLIAQKKRKKKEGELEIIGISWNHKGDPTCGGIHYHMGGPNSPEDMTDKPDPKQDKMETRCVLVSSKLTKLTVDVTIKLGAGAEQGKSGKLCLFDLSGESVLGNGSANYTLSPGGQCTVSIPLNGKQLTKDVAQLFTCPLQFKDGSSFLTNCDCAVYLLPNMPAKPWDSAEGTEYSRNKDTYLRLEFANLFMPRDSQKRDFAKWAVEKLNQSGFVYDEEGGACKYSDYGYWRLRLEKFVRDLNDMPKTKREYVLNCSDCAHIVSTACAMVGENLPMTMFIGYNGNRQFFSCNQIVVIGRKEWKHPFEKNGGGGFSYHMFNARVQDGKTPLIFDACLKVDEGSYPGKDSPGVKKKECLPTGMPACETTSSKVNVPTDTVYNKKFYRERLVCTDNYCNFFPGYIQNVVGFSDVTTTAKLVPNESIFQVMKIFSLFPTPEERKALEARPKRAWTLRNIPGLTVEQEVEWHGFGSVAEPACQIEHWRFDTADEAAMHLGAVVASFAAPQKCAGQQAGVDVGERCVVVADRDIIFCRLGHVFSVEADLLSDAYSVAQRLDKSVSV